MYTYRQVELPEELQRKMSSKFWKTSAMARIPSSTFGTSPKGRVAPTLDDGYEVMRSSKKWLAIDEHNCNHGRVRIETMLGKLQETPAPGHYSPKIDKQSKRETIAPMITISTKPEDRYLEDMEDLRKTRVAISLLDNPLMKEKTKKKRSSVYRIKPGQLSGVNIDDMRKGEGGIAS